MLYNVSQEVIDAQKVLGKTGITDRLHYCYRCYACARLITKLEVLEGRSQGRIELCTCGSKLVRPANAKIWEELFLPRCWKLIYAIYTKQIAPAPPPPTVEEETLAKKMARQAMYAFNKQMNEARQRALDENRPGVRD